MSNMPEEFYIVAAIRRDGGMPSLVKTLHDTIYHSLEDAIKTRDGYNRAHGKNIWGVYRVVAEVTEEVKKRRKS